jgi:hypothetical protein
LNGPDLVSHNTVLQLCKQSLKNKTGTVADVFYLTSFEEVGTFVLLETGNNIHHHLPVCCFKQVETTSIHHLRKMDLAFNPTETGNSSSPSPSPSPRCHTSSSQYPRRLQSKGQYARSLEESFGVGCHHSKTKLFSLFALFAEAFFFTGDFTLFSLTTNFLTDTAFFPDYVP